MYGMEILYYVLGSVVLFAGGGLLMRWAFGGKKADKEKSEKLFETTAFLKAVGQSLPRKLR